MASTTIDPRNVHITEKDIEDWLWENPEALVIWGSPITRWVARQYRVPSGIIDLLGIIEDDEPMPVVVELKNTEITAEALTQVCRYAADIESVLAYDGFTRYTPRKVVIGKGEVTNEIQFESEALSIWIFSVDIQLNITLGGPWSWTGKYQDKLERQHVQLSNDPLLAVFKVDLKNNDTQDVISEARRIIEEASEENDEGE